ncbi:MAG: hypothetical protein A2138_01755 [Deltaproteobacteria bacterium RBG_16_71_12]|nr:MAG: hypothetical protein A2138_01755 [Deltaproteobacteria bacterium RBG_16_71_12]
MRRRDFLLTTVPLALAATGARAIGPRSQVGVGRLKHGGAWDSRPEALRRLLWEAGKRTSISVARDAAVVSLDEDTPEGRELFWQPLVFLSGEGELPPFSARQRARLERHLRYGGMLVIDAPSAADPFTAGAKRELAAVLPGTTLRALDGEHVIFKSFYLLDGAVGRTRDDAHLYAVDVAGRAAVVLSTNDLLGALERDRFGTWRFDCEPDGDAQRELAFRLAVNLLMYATCLDYKEDQVHIPFIMKKKRR